MAVAMGFLLVLAMAGLFLLTPVVRSGKVATRGVHALDEMVIEDHGSRHKVAVIEVDGIISSQSWDGGGHSMVKSIQDQLDTAADDDAVIAVILKVDSPGGEVLASDDIARAIAKFEVESGKPVVSSMGSMAASGGYYISAPCRWIVANDLTMTGSIGVIMQSFNYRGLMDKVGLQPQVFKSGRFKDMLSGSKRPADIDPEEHRMIQAMIDETYGKFKSVVAEGREKAARANEGQGKSLATDWADYADGRILTGKQAFDLGFVDELGSFETAVDRALKIAGVPNADLIQYRHRVDLSDILGIFGKSESRKIRIDLGIESPRLQTGRLYFLAPTYLH